MSLLNAVELVGILLVVAAGVAYGMLVVFAELIGWRALVRRFGYARDFTGTFATSEGVLLGRHLWNAPPLRVGVDERGIVLRPLAPLRGAFRVVRVPWHAITSVETGSFMFFDTTTLRYGTAPDAAIAFVAPGDVAAAIEARRTAAW